MVKIKKHLLGIISDTHDNLSAIDKAVEIFNSRGVSLVIHAGDYIAPFAMARFSNLKSDFKGVFGNNDGERVGVQKKASDLGSKIEDLLELTYEGKKIAVYHGTHNAVVKALVKSKSYDVVLVGHEHKADVRKENGVLVVNPGEACGYLTGKKTLCILDIEKLKAEIVTF